MNWCTRFCRPVPNHSAIAPSSSSRSRLVTAGVPGFALRSGGPSGSEDGSKDPQVRRTFPSGPEDPPGLRTGPRTDPCLTTRPSRRTADNHYFFAALACAAFVARAVAFRRFLRANRRARFFLILNCCVIGGEYVSKSPLACQRWRGGKKFLQLPNRCRGPQ